MDQEALEFIQDFATNKWGACTRFEEVMIGHVDPAPTKDSKLFWTRQPPADEEFEKTRVEAES